MLPKGSFAAEFGLKVLLPSLSAAAGIAFLLISVINGLLNEMNSIDRQYANRAAESFVNSLRTQIENVAASHSRLDDSTRGTGSSGDVNWLLDIWRTSMASGVYDSAFMTDASGRTAAAIIGGNPSDIAVQDYAGPGALRLIEALPPSIGPFSVASTIVKHKDQFYVVAAASISATTDDAATPSRQARLLVVARTLDRDFLALQGRKFGLENVQLAEAGAVSDGGFRILSPHGRFLGRLIWTGHNPGQAAGAKYRREIWELMASFVFVFGMLAYMSWSGFREAHIIKSRAVAASLHDDLTGLANRRKVIETLSGILATEKSQEPRLSVIYADLDGFKDENDAYGHEIGDLLLKTAAGGFQYLAAGRGLVSRLGGDEFAVIVDGPDSAAIARGVARNMIRFLAEPIVFGGRVASVSVSIGIVDMTAKDQTIDAEEILRRADVAMYAAKTGGRNRVHIYDQSLDDKRDESRRMARELRAALDSGSLGVVYQPIVDARTREIMGVEALVRWPKASSRIIPPDIFVPVAEEFGMIEDLGYFVMMQACEQAARWPGISMSVNVSPIQFMNPAYAETVERILNITGLDPHRLEIEVTEGFIIDNAERAAAIIDQLHEMRVSVALDDFGTGYSSIGHLRRFKFDKLKLDRSMVADILRQPSALRLVQGTIAMADALGLSVTAEGVEDENQISILRLAGCRLFQGFLFSKPVAAQQISALLEGKHRAIAV